MKIKYHGHACFELENEGVKVVLDPFQEEIGLKLPALEAQMVTVSQDEAAHNNTQGVKGNPKIFNWPGEYEMGGIHFKLIVSYGDEKKNENVISIILIKGFKLCHLGAQSQKLSSDELEQIGDVDVLFVPVGGSNLFDAKKAKECVEQIEPRLVIPMCYHLEGGKLSMSPVNNFLSEMGSVNSEPLNELKLKRSDLPEENSKVIVLAT